MRPASLLAYMSLSARFTRDSGVSSVCARVTPRVVPVTVVYLLEVVYIDKSYAEGRFMPAHLPETAVQHHLRIPPVARIGQGVQQNLMAQLLHPLLHLQPMGVVPKDLDAATDVPGSIAHGRTTDGHGHPVSRPMMQEGARLIGLAHLHGL